MQKPESNGGGSSPSELWRDGLLCAYEYLPAENRTYKFGGKFGNKSGPLPFKGKFNAELTVNQPAAAAAAAAAAGGGGAAAAAAIAGGGHGDSREALTDGGGGGSGRSRSRRNGGARAAAVAGEDAAGDGDGTAALALGQRQQDWEQQVVESSSAAAPDQPYNDGDDEDESSQQQQQPRRQWPQWVPIGWSRIAELVQQVRIDAEWISQPRDDSSPSAGPAAGAAADDDTLSVANVAAPFFQAPAGPTWWCHVLATHPTVVAWLAAASAAWLHPAVSAALRDESRLISDRMKYLYYEVPVRVAGGLLFELLGQSVGEEAGEDVPVVLRSWQAQRYLITAAHVKGDVDSNLNVLGVVEVQDLVGAGGSEAPKSAHEVIALLASRLARWDDRLFRKRYFGAADEVELKFVAREENEDLTVLTLILNQEIRRLANWVIRVKWSLHAREDIVFELTEHLRGKVTQMILKQVKQDTREMINEQEAVRARLFIIQDVMQSTLRAGLQDKSIRIQHNLGVIGGVGLLLSILTGLFGVNLDGIPGNSDGKHPYAFAGYSVTLLVLACALVTLGMLYLGLKKPIAGQVTVRRAELQRIVKDFQHQAVSHAKVQGSGGSSGGNLNGGHGNRGGAAAAVSKAFHNGYHVYQVGGGGGEGGGLSSHQYHHQEAGSGGAHQHIPQSFLGEMRGYPRTGSSGSDTGEYLLMPA